jgi:hypothetical protein
MLNVGVGDLVRMGRDAKDLPTGVVVEAEVEYFKGSTVWCHVLWDDGTVSAAWNDELRKVDAKG